MSEDKRIHLNIKLIYNTTCQQAIDNAASSPRTLARKAENRQLVMTTKTLYAKL